MKQAYKGNVVFKDTVIKGGYVVIEDGKIIYVGKDVPEYDAITDVGEDYIAPGFVDIHNHSSRKNTPEGDIDEMADFHLSKGTTTMLMTLYRDFYHERMVNTLYKIKDAMKRKKNVYGAHLEGPYLSSKRGTGAGVKQVYPDKKDYQQYLDTGIVRQITCAPEVDGVHDFIKDATAQGVVIALGHSDASYEQVEKAYRYGARIETHTFDATGTTRDPKSFSGTLDVSFDCACMLMDDMYYEVICDSEWVHVRKEMLKLLIKTVGIDRIVGITDCYMGGDEDGRDINVIDGSLSGSKLTMDRVAINLFNAGYTLPQIAKITATNPAKAIKAFDRGEI
ncbi:MAG: amidohydrolase family protein, partial [Clostridia bacterium]|nr:amidohydrolase family protein [Clostridia bacterium]